MSSPIPGYDYGILPFKGKLCLWVKQIEIGPASVDSEDQNQAKQVVVIPFSWLIKSLDKSAQDELISMNTFESCSVKMGLNAFAKGIHPNQPAHSHRLICVGTFCNGSIICITENHTIQGQFSACQGNILLRSNFCISAYQRTILPKVNCLHIIEPYYLWAILWKSENHTTLGQLSANYRTILP